MSTIHGNLRGYVYPKMVLEGVTSKNSGLGVYVKRTEALLTFALSMRTVTGPFMGRWVPVVPDVMQVMLSFRTRPRL